MRRRSAPPVVHWPLIALAGLGAGLGISFSAAAPSPGWALLLLGPAIWRPLRLTALLAAALVAWIAWQHGAVLAARLPPALHGSEQTIRGQIIGVPERNATVARFLFESPDWPGGRLRLGWYRDAPQLTAGDCWQLRLRLREPRGSTNPGGMDYEGWLFRQRIIATGTVRAGESCGTKSGIDTLRQRWAATIRESLGPGRPAATISALALGLRDDLTDADWDILRRTGTSHLFAISGLHLGLIAALGFALGRGVWRAGGYRAGGRAATWGAMTAGLLSLGYAAMAGFGIPVQRALVMSLLGVFAVSSGRWRAPLPILSLAAVVVLALDPLAISAPGFWLSFTAAAGILLWLNWQPSRPWPLRLLEIQLMLGLLLMPLTVGFFGGASLLALPVNLLLVPIFSLLLPLVLLASLWHVLPGGSALLQATGAVLDGLWQLLAGVAQWSLAYLQPAVPPAGLLLLALAGLLLLLLPRAVGARLPGMICLLPALLYIPPRPAPGELWLHVWDVGQGQSVLLETANYRMLYDAGPAWPGGFDAGAGVVVPYLQVRGVNRIDRLLLSHGDRDHAGGVPAVRAALPVASLLGTADSPRCESGHAWVWDGVQFTVLHPPPRAGPRRRDRNNDSCVLRIDGPQGSALLAGDIEASAEQALLARQGAAALKAEVLVAPHHGSRTSSTEALVDAVAPAWVLFGAGWRHHFGHPHPTVEMRWRDTGSSVGITGDAGALEIRWDDDGHLRMQAWRQVHRWRWTSPVQP